MLQNCRKIVCRALAHDKSGKKDLSCALLKVYDKQNDFAANAPDPPPSDSHAPTPPCTCTRLPRTHDPTCQRLPRTLGPHTHDEHGTSIFRSNNPNSPRDLYKTALLPQTLPLPQPRSLSSLLPLAAAPPFLPIGALLSRRSSLSPWRSGSSDAGTRSSGPDDASARAGSGGPLPFTTETATTDQRQPGRIPCATGSPRAAWSAPHARSALQGRHG
jgi:hypothetical protein